MAVANYSAADFGGTGPVPAAGTAGPLRVELDDLLYSPDQPDDPEPRRNEPFAPPSHPPRRSKLRKRAGAAYLPPPNQFTQYSNENPYAHPQLHTRVFQQLDERRLDYNTGQYVHDPTGDYDYEQRHLARPGYTEAYTPTPALRRNDNPGREFHVPAPPPPAAPPSAAPAPPVKPQPPPPDRQPAFTKVESGGSGGKTQVHAVLDYDDDYYDDVPGPGVPGLSGPAVTPLQGPILLRNGTVPVVPLTSYPTVNNGSFYQIPILWTALSVALGYELQGQVIKGVPCVKRNYQLYCPTAGNTYPLEKIETFIDENKALIKRMYGSFATPGGGRVRRAPGVPDVDGGDSYFRHVRQAANTPLPDPQATNSTGRIDACESKTEIMTPYWALNSARKVRAIVNTMHFEQAIHQEVCSKKSTSRCSGDCGCEQKYKWHRLLAYDPTDDCAGIFMDWFLFPSCCVCRCNP